jgi:hypothetical protein
MEEVSAVVIALLMLILGLTGLVLASGALDNEMYVFGLSLAAFAAVFELGLIKAHFDRRDRARHAAGGTHV